MLRAADIYDIKVCMYITILKNEQLLSALTGLNQFAPVVKVALFRNGRHNKSAPGVALN